MRRKWLSPDYRLIYAPYFPYERKRNSSSFGHRAVIGIGGNTGNVVRRFAHLFVFLRRRKDAIAIVETSPILKNPPFGYANQPDFYNAVMTVETRLNPRALLHFLLRTEKRFGRKRTFKNAPRTLDLDLIFYDDRRMERNDLTLPHPHWSERDSILIPLSFIQR